MTIRKSKDLWEFSSATNITSIDRLVILILTIAGIVSLINFGEWWFREKHIANMPAFVILSTFFWYNSIRILFVWLNYMKMKTPKIVPKPDEGLSVAVFTTSAPGEPISMYEKTFEALGKLTYPHTTYLLDSTKDPAFKTLAEKYGIVWLNLADLPGAKAGKINEALKITTEEFILILDPDHIVFPNFLDQTLGFFKDEKIGFVQVSQGYYNQYRSFTAAGAAEQTYVFYGPTQMGMYGMGSAVAIGANCTFRRKALESIGGHAIGLAEDLITSIRIHAQGWKSVYNPVIVSRGLVPEDLSSFCKQQLKWARGTFEILFTELPNLFFKLSFRQRIIYLTTGTYYLVGATTFFFIIVPFLYFLTGIIPGRMTFAEFIIEGSPVIVIASLLYAYIQKFLCHPESERKFHWKGMILKFSSWPVFLLGFFLAIADKEIPYIPTAKKAAIGYITPYAKPLAIYCLMFVVLVTTVYIQRRYYIPESELIFSSEKVWGMVGFSFIAFAQSLIGIFAAYEAKFLKEEEPWQKIDVTKIKV